MRFSAPIRSSSSPSGRPDEAVALVQRARRRSGNLESRIMLGTSCCRRDGSTKRCVYATLPPKSRRITVRYSASPTCRSGRFQARQRRRAGKPALAGDEDAARLFTRATTEAEYARPRSRWRGRSARHGTARHRGLFTRSTSPASTPRSAIASGPRGLGGAGQKAATSVSRCSRSTGPGIPCATTRGLPPSCSRLGFLIWQRGAARGLCYAPAGSDWRRYAMRRTFGVLVLVWRL